MSFGTKKSARINLKNNVRIVVGLVNNKTENNLYTFKLWFLFHVLFQQ